MKQPTNTKDNKTSAPLAVSAIVCTHNRADSLRATLESLRSQTLADEAYEIIVVDNGSVDATRSVVSAFQKKSSVQVLYLYEKTIGLSGARNRGVQNAAGRLLFFIDDDARADRDLLAKYVDVFSSPGEIIAAGGPVEFLNSMVRPAWFPRRLVSHLSIVNYGHGERYLVYPYFPFGTNMVFHRSVFNRIGFFDTAFGRKGRQSFNTCEETDLFMRIQRQGGKIYYHPGAKVYHNIRPAQLKPDWICRQTYHIGYACALIESKAFSPFHTGIKFLMSVAGMSAAGICRICSDIIPNDYLRVYSTCILANRQGYLVGVLKRYGLF